MAKVVVFEIILLVLLLKVLVDLAALERIVGASVIGLRYTVRLFRVFR